MSPTDRYRAEFVESFPAPLDLDGLYVSTKYATAAHLCPCGCGSDVVTKLSPARWTFIFDGEVSLRPSVASTGIPCNSHYFITRGFVEWSRPLSAVQANRARDADRVAVDELRVDRPRPWPVRVCAGSGANSKRTGTGDGSSSEASPTV